MTFQFRPVTEEEIPEYTRVIELGFGEIPPASHVSTWIPLLEPGRSLAAFDGKDMVGGASAAALDLTVPGAVVSVGAVIGAAVLPTHTRRGLLRSMMQLHFQDMRERGEILSALWASESLIYGRFGYAVGSLSAQYELNRVHGAFLADGRVRPAPGRVRLMDTEPGLAAVPAVYEQFRVAQVGAPGRSPEWWRHIHSDTEHRRAGATPLFVVTHDTEGVLDGYAIYRLKEEDVADGLWAFRLLLKELVATNVEAYAALWQYCANVDMVDRVMVENRPVDDPIVHMLADSRRLRRRVWDGMWIRLLDVPAALGRRSYRTAGSAVFGVHDPICPWNEGSVRLEAGPEGAWARAVNDAPDIECQVVDLAAAYLGTCSLTSLARAGRVVEHAPGALARADALFAWDPAPWCPNVF